MIIPAILAHSLEDFQNKWSRVSGLSSWVHVDVMDGKFVEEESNLLMDIPHPRTVKVEAHLMVDDPVQYVQTCHYVKIERVIIHQEISRNFLQILELYKEQGISVGVAINPGTPVLSVKEIIPHVDKVLIMSVFPGKQGQMFIPEMLEKVASLRLMRKDLLIGMDGGINQDNIGLVHAMGVEDMTVGSGLFKARDIKKQWAILQTNKGA